MCFVPFPGLSSLGDQVLGEYTVPGARCGLSPPWSRPLGFWVCHESTVSGVLVCLLWEAHLRLRLSWQMSTVQDPRKTWLAVGACSQFGGGCRLWGQDCPSPSGSGCRLPASLPPGGDGLVCSQLALLWYSLSPLFYEQAQLCLRLELFARKFSLSLFFFFFFALSGYLTVWVAISR